MNKLSIVVFALVACTAFAKPLYRPQEELMKSLTSEEGSMRVKKAMDMLNQINPSDLQKMDLMRQAGIIAGLLGSLGSALAPAIGGIISPLLVNLANGIAMGVTSVFSPAAGRFPNMEGYPSLNNMENFHMTAGYNPYLFNSDNKINHASPSPLSSLPYYGGFYNNKYHQTLAALQSVSPAPDVSQNLEVNQRTARASKA